MTSKVTTGSNWGISQSVYWPQISNINVSGVIYPSDYKASCDKSVSKILTCPNNKLMPNEKELINILNMIMCEDADTVKLGHETIRELEPNTFLYIMAFTSIYRNRFHSIDATFKKLNKQSLDMYDAFAFYTRIESTIESCVNSVITYMADYVDPTESRLSSLEILVRETNAYKYFKKSYIEHTSIKFKRTVE